MGRPIKKKFFGNLITPYQNHATGGKTGVGAEGVSSVTVTNSGTNYSQGVTISFAAPDIAGGITATGTPVIPATGANAGDWLAFPRSRLLLLLLPRPPSPEPS